jgi:NAD(P)-dependent dehydrogenase (short-subunit alcohol dehydrogenase family)
MSEKPVTQRPNPPFAAQQQKPPGHTAGMLPKPDHGEHRYEGHGRLRGKAALITGGDSGIGRAIAIAFAREGADVVISYLDEHEDAAETARWIEKAKRRVLTIGGDITQAEHCTALVEKTVSEFGKIDVLVNNAAMQRTHDDIGDISDAEWDKTFRTNVYAMFYLCGAALKHMRSGGSIINTSSINEDNPNPALLAYATTKGAIANFTAGLAQSVAERGIRVNAVAPGPIWTPLIPSTMKNVEHFGKNTPIGRAGQPAELAPAYVLLASDESSYMTGALIPVTGGRPIL